MAREPNDTQTCFAFMKYMYILFATLLMIACTSDKKSPDNPATHSNKVETNNNKPASNQSMPQIRNTPVRASGKVNGRTVTAETDQPKQPLIVSENEKPVAMSTRAEKDKIAVAKADKSDAVKAKVKVQSKSEMNENDDSKMVSPDHESFNKLLQTYVSDAGVVDYAGLKMESDKLTKYVEALGKKDINALSGRNAKMAYWINLYNAATLKLVLDNYPLGKITDLDNGKTWDVKRINVNGKKMSLNQIEHDILRPQYNDARIHFAVNCAAKSCPPLANRAYTANNLESLLESRAKSFINNSKYNQLNKNSITVSKIFEWYREDFTPDLLSYIKKYSTTEIDSDAAIKFKDYNWALNGK